MTGGALVYFQTDSAGTIDYDPSLEGILSGRGTTALRVNGAAVTIDASTLTSDYLSMDYMAQDKSSPINARLLPGSHSLVTHGGSVAYFTVTNSGKVDYDTALEGIITGSGTSTLHISGATVRVDATALTTDYLTMDYVVQDKTAPIR